MTTNKYRIDINIVDDHSMLTESLTEAINRSDTAHVSHIFSSLDSCRQAIVRRCPDILLLDISLPDGDGIEFSREILQTLPKIKILCVSIHDEYSVIQRMLDTGVHGYLLKSSSVSELINAVQAVWQGQTYISQEVKEIISRSEPQTVFLSGVERNILRLICEGYSNPQIAPKLCLSTETVNWYRKRLLSKFHVNNTVKLVTLALKEQLV